MVCVFVLLNHFLYSLCSIKSALLKPESMPTLHHDFVISRSARDLLFTWDYLTLGIGAETFVIEVGILTGLSIMLSKFTRTN